MKFGEYLKENMVSEWSGKYVNYDALKSIISSLEEKNAMGNLSVTSESKQVSLTMALPTNAAGQPLRGRSDVSPEQFFGLIELEMKKVDDKHEYVEIERLAYPPYRQGRRVRSHVEI